MADSAQSEPSPAKSAPHAPAKPPAEMAVTAWEDPLTRGIASRFGARVLSFASYLGQNFLTVEADAVLELLAALRSEWEFDFLADLTALDYPARPARFELVYILYSFSRNERLRVKCATSLGGRPPSIASLFPAANWLEREVFDMFGIEFSGHPDLRRILLPEEWTGFPLRRDESILAMDNRWVKENLGIESGQ